MDYYSIVSTVFWVIQSLIGLCLVHFVFFGLVGAFARKKFPKAKVQHKYGVVISARNEEAVIGNLIKSIQKQNYPQELLQIFVVAHNCTDQTAEISRELGATVYEYNNPNERTKGYALKYLFNRINEDYAESGFEGFMMFDADNILDTDCVSYLNDAFEAGGCQDTVTSFRNAKNFNTNIMSGAYGIFFMTGCRFGSRGRTVCGCSTRVQGTGYLIPAEVVKDGWNYVTLTEDWEFTADQVLQGNKIIYCDDAVFYDEQPTTTKVMLRQRLRWARGHLLVFFTRSKALFKSLFKRTPKGEKSHKFSKYDALINSLPVCATNVVLWLLNFILITLTPLFGVDAAVFWENYGIMLGISVVTAYFSTMLEAILIFILEHKRIKCNWFKKILIILFWPIFVFVSMPLEVVSLFCKNLGWSKIPHTDTTNFETLNQGAITEAETNSEEVETTASEVPTEASQTPN